MSDANCSKSVSINAISPGTISGGGTLCAPFDAAEFASETPGSGGGPITYQWQRRTGTDPFADIGGATLATYDAPAVTAATDFRRVATSTLNMVPCAAISNELRVTPNAVTAGTISGGGTLCAPFDADAFASETPGSGGGPITYQWQRRTGTDPFADIGGATLATYDAPVVAVVTDFRRVATSTLNMVPCA
ncbi:hypothetical protein, partial [Hymenobacter antarcticus]